MRKGANQLSSMLAGQTTLTMLARQAVHNKKVIAALRATPYFADLGEIQMQMLARSGKVRNLSRYAAVYREGAAAHAFYVLMSGAVELTTMHKQSLHEHHHSGDVQGKRYEVLPGEVGTCFGTDALSSLPRNGGRAPTPARSRQSGRQSFPIMRRARSERNTVLTSGPFWAVPYAPPAPATTPILERPPRQTACVVTSPKAQMVVIPVSSLAIGRGGQVSVTATVMESYIAAEFQSMGVFAGVPLHVLRDVVPLFELEEKPKQVAVFEEGWAGDKFYILLYGKLRVFKGEVQLALLDAHPDDEGDGNPTSYPFFGEMALMDAAPRMATVHTLSACKILSLSRANFGHFLSLIPDFKERVARTKTLRKKESEINTGLARAKEDRAKEDLAAAAPLDDKLDDVHQILALQQVRERSNEMAEEEELLKSRWEEEQDKRKGGGPSTRSAEEHDAAVTVQKQVRGHQARKAKVAAVLERKASVKAAEAAALAAGPEVEAARAKAAAEAEARRVAEEEARKIRQEELLRQDDDIR